MRPLHQEAREQRAPPLVEDAQQHELVEWLHVLPPEQPLRSADWV